MNKKISLVVVIVCFIAITCVAAILQSGWTSTTSAPTARTALGVLSSTETTNVAFIVAGTNNPHVVYVSKLPGINQNSTEWVPTGTDDWLVIQTALNTATNIGYLELYNDGRSLLSKGLKIHSNTKIINHGSFIMATNSLQPILQNMPNATNLWIEGGIWNQHYPGQTRNTSNPFVQGLIWVVDNNTNSIWVNGFHFWQNARYITVKDVEIRNACVWGMAFQDTKGDVALNDIRITRPTVALYNAGIQLWGNMTNFVARNIYIEGNDDALGFQPTEMAYYFGSTNAGVLWSTNQGNYKNVLYDGVVIKGGNAIRFANYGLGTFSGATNISIENLTIKGLRFDGFTDSVFNNDGSFTNTGTLIFDDWTIIGRASGQFAFTPLVNLNGFRARQGQLSNIRIGDYRDTFGDDQYTALITMDNAGSNWIVSGINFTERNTSGSLDYLFNITNHNPGDRIIISGITTDSTQAIFTGGPSGNIRVTGISKPLATVVNGGTFTNLITDLTTLNDPNADRIVFWDESAGAFAYLTAGSGLSIAGTTITATGSGGDVTFNPTQFSTANGSTNIPYDAPFTNINQLMRPATTNSMWLYDVSQEYQYKYQSGGLISHKWGTDASGNPYFSFGNASVIFEGGFSSLGPMIGDGNNFTNLNPSKIVTNTPVAGDVMQYTSGSTAKATSDLTISNITALTVVGNGTGLTNLNATELRSGTVATARLGSGTANSTTFLRGDNTWATPAGGDGGSATNTFYVTNSAAADYWTNTFGGSNVLSSGFAEFYPGPDANTVIRSGGQVSRLSGGLQVDGGETFFFGDVGLGSEPGDFFMNDGTMSDLIISGTLTGGGIDVFMRTNEVNRISVRTNSTVVGPQFTFMDAQKFAQTNATRYVQITNGVVLASGNVAGLIFTTLGGENQVSATAFTSGSSPYRRTGVFDLTVNTNGPVIFTSTSTSIRTNLEVLGLVTSSTNVTVAAANTAGYTNSSVYETKLLNRVVNIAGTSGLYIYYQRSGNNGATVCGLPVWTNTIVAAGACIPVGVNCGIEIVSGVSTVVGVYTP